MEKGKVIVIVAPSGSGKTTLIQRIKKEFPEIVESISHTTRPMRPLEVHGESYFFTDEKNFNKMVEKNEFLEWAVVHENYYGTSKVFLMNEITEGKSVLCDIDVQGADNVKDFFKDDSITIFIAPPSIDELRARLEGRGTETEEVINIRINNAKRELLRKDDYDYCVVNDDLEKAYVELKELFSRIIEE